MHDPLVVAFEIKRPWPDSYKTAGRRRRYWPTMITVWHREPGGHNWGTVCKRDGHWRLHVHHYRIQVRPLQKLRRWVLTRCEWCGGRSRKGDQVNFSSSWNGIRTRWWRGEGGLRHHDCSTVWLASRKCLCDHPALPEGWGECGNCGKSRAFGTDVTEADRLLAALPAGSRIPLEMRPQLEAIWNARAVARGDDPATMVKPWRQQ